MLETLAHLFTPQQTNNHRPRILHPEGLVVLTAIALIFHILIRTAPGLATNGSVLGYSSSITMSQVLSSINAQREHNGLSDLKSNDKLDQAASAKASDMFAQQYWAHTSPTGVTPWFFLKNAGYEYSVAGENLARDFGDTDSMISAWMESPSHKENILNSKYIDTGIAVLDGQLQGTQTTLVVQMFAAPSVAQPTVQTNKPLVQIVTKVQAETQVPTATQQADVKGTSVPATQKPTAQQPITKTPTEFSTTPTYSPLQLSKAVALSMLTLLIGVLAYDMVMAHKHKTVRITGKNLAHIALFTVVALAVIFFKGGLLS
ncbi:MAG TPA: CAP domain-containing protein [Candidatus Saccharimonadia bacterium]|nr:CAP domain-containing protein [Candidatus Saccharimonadia bacterium]